MLAMMGSVANQGGEYLIKTIPTLVLPIKSEQAMFQYSNPVIVTVAQITLTNVEVWNNKIVVGNITHYEPSWGHIMYGRRGAYGNASFTDVYLRLGVKTKNNNKFYAQLAYVRANYDISFAVLNQVIGAKQILELDSDPNSIFLMVDVKGGTLELNNTIL